MIKNTILHFLGCKSLMDKVDRHGEIPSASVLYQNAFRIAWPSIIEAVLVTLISFVDTMMVGVLGPSAIAAVGITAQPRLIILATILSFNVGVTAVVSRKKGSGDQDGANSCLKQCMIISALMALFLSCCGILFARPLLSFAGAGADIIDDSVGYFRIIMIGIFFNAISLTINSAQRGVGNTKVSMQTNLSANIVNVIFNFFLINGVWFFPRLEVRGAAVATVLGDITALSLALISVIRRHSFLDLKSHTSWKFDTKTISGVFNVGLSAMVEQVFMRIGFFMYVKIISGLGTNAFATHQICMNILGISFGFGDGLQIASASLVGQSLGAKRPDLAKLYVAVSQRIGMMIASVIFIIFITGRTFLVGLFTTDTAIIAQGSVLMIIIAFTVHAQICQVITSGSLRGAGDTKYTAMVSLVSIAVVRPSLTWLLCYPMGFGLIGAWVALIIDQFMRLGFMLMRFRKDTWTQLEL